MKLSFLFAVLSVVVLSTRNVPAQNLSNVSDNKIISTNPLNSFADIVPGVILLKFKDNVTPVVLKAGTVIQSGIPALDALLREVKLNNAVRLFPGEEKKKISYFNIGLSDKALPVPSLHNIYRIELTDNQTNIFELIDRLKSDENVEYAEPDYILSVVEATPLSRIYSESELTQFCAETNPKNNGTAKLNSTPNDPLYSQQWGIPSTQIDAVWDSIKGDTTQIIAILDTGVDWLHPDLKNKIWSNPNEIPGNGVDDDANGYIDDIRGWDWINNDNNPTDDNAHGTHVAGIAAAETNNGVGISGVNWYAKILPLKVFQSSGRGDVATITQAVIYAKNKGVTVINMSFGSFARSLTMEAALANAYPVSILVGAAGNDGLCIGPGKCDDGRFGAPFFPAALPYVIGVQAPPNPPFGFTNYDEDGPVFSAYPDLFNYEVTAPGVQIISTVPNGGYRILQGTSMAAPLVSGALSLYRKARPNQSFELMWGNIIRTTGSYIQLRSALAVTPKPALMFVSTAIVDTIDGDRDGRTDAGETIELWFKVRNNWGQADSVKLRIMLDEFEDTSLVHFQTSQVTIGRISPYAIRTNELFPLKLKLSSLINHGRDIRFKAMLWQPGYPDTVFQNLTFTVENGIELNGYRAGTLRLSENRFYIVTSNFAVDTLIIEPGTTIRFYSQTSLYVLKHLSASGTPLKKILFTSDGADPWRHISVVEGNGLVKYCIFEKSAGYAYQGVGIAPGIVAFEDCIFRENSGIMFQTSGASFTRCVFINNSADFQVWTRGLVFKNNLVTNNYNAQVSAVNFLGDLVTRAEKNSWYSNFPFDISVREVPWAAYTLAPNYFGTTNLSRINSHILDFWEEPALPILDPSGFLATPSDSTHAHLWKILVDGKDAQDDAPEPLGIGKHKFEVFFNRTMDTSFIPQITFGVREPFTQNAVSDSGRWSVNRKSRIAYHTVKLYTGDGINTIRVEGARDLEGFEIPVEKQRFSVLINGAGSASAEFQANPGIGKIMLEWNKSPQITDLLGFNLYRFKKITDTTFTVPELLNLSLLTDTLYTDFQVLPGKRYYYYYKIVRTNFSETDSSRIVSSIPLTAARGDANGDLSVNVLDITTIVSYILNQNPHPFVFEAADVNRDSVVNVLDIVGLVNIILGNTNLAAKIATGPELRLESNKLSIYGGASVSAMQFKFTVKNKKNLSILNNPKTQMEMIYTVNADTVNLILFSFANRTLSDNPDNVLFTIEGAEFNQLLSTIAGDALGNNISLNSSNTVSGVPDKFILSQNYPNPFNPVTVIKFGIPETAECELEIFNLLGERIYSTGRVIKSAGYHTIQWNAVNNSGTLLPSGVYIYRLKSGSNSLIKKMLLLR